MCNQCTRPSRVLIGELESIISGEGEYDLSPAPPAAAPATLSWRLLPLVIAGNRQTAADIHWGCFDGTKVRASNAVLQLLGLPQGTTPGEADWANAVLAWQAKKGLEPTGILDAATWAAMQKELPIAKFKPLVIPVIVNGKKLGVIEKTKPYITTPDAVDQRGGTTIELGFRITDPDAVRKAGFIATDGRPPFRWLQTFEISNIANPHGNGMIRKFAQAIDPTVLLKAPLDENPYYWDEEPPLAPHPKGATAEIDQFINRPASNHLCYDLIFKDFPSAPNALANPGRRFYFNVETALVGIRQGDPIRNTILDTVTWGYDLVATKGTTEIRLNHLGPGVKGGSPTFKKILSKEIGNFPHHCYTSVGYSKTATCK